MIDPSPRTVLIQDLTRRLNAGYFDGTGGMLVVREPHRATRMQRFTADEVRAMLADLQGNVKRARFVPYPKLSRAR